MMRTKDEILGEVQKALDVRASLGHRGTGSHGDPKSAEEVMLRCILEVVLDLRGEPPPELDEKSAAIVRGDPVGTGG